MAHVWDPRAARWLRIPNSHAGRYRIPGPSLLLTQVSAGGSPAPGQPAQLSRTAPHPASCKPQPGCTGSRGPCAAQTCWRDPPVSSGPGPGTRSRGRWDRFPSQCSQVCATLLQGGRKSIPCHRWALARGLALACVAVAARKGSLRAQFPLQDRSEPLRTSTRRSELSGALCWQRGREETGERVGSRAKAGSSPGSQPGAEQTGPCCGPQALGWRMGLGSLPHLPAAGCCGPGEGGNTRNCLGVSNQHGSSAVPSPGSWLQAAVKGRWRCPWVARP
ncbi:hypothetical protein KIL84_018173 [Mauremys mutica]|uniref:Uncharacterized protein n=1 Tax=Mauremys mutica TaxID=74926 RepID=A0A9D3XPU3_9SAUR|nr:hypothetical protein KIL84_018173 [Mauremys mutica]